MTIPRVLSLATDGREPLLRMTPAPELESLHLAHRRQRPGGDDAIGIEEQDRRLAALPDAGRDGRLQLRPGGLVPVAQVVLLEIDVGRLRIS